mmetsp:Transcript_86554/g.249750  ORF Transcript_86554/g.249750 Transcript_86554/m.249750 type:complete len:286 (-) Transcript_86554:67-924(-)
MPRAAVNLCNRPGKNYRATLPTPTGPGSHGSKCGRIRRVRWVGGRVCARSKVAIRVRRKQPIAAVGRQAMRAQWPLCERAPAPDVGAAIKLLARGPAGLPIGQPIVAIVALLRQVRRPGRQRRRISNWACLALIRATPSLHRRGPIGLEVRIAGRAVVWLLRRDNLCLDVLRPRDSRQYQGNGNEDQENADTAEDDDQPVVARCAKVRGCRLHRADPADPATDVPVVPLRDEAAVPGNDMSRPSGGAGQAERTGAVHTEGHGLADEGLAAEHRAPPPRFATQAAA